MRRISILALAAVSGLTMSSGVLQADTLTFHDGREALQCRVLEDDPGSATILVEINVTDTIKDRKAIPRADVKQITKVPPDKMDYDELQKKVWPTPDMLSSEDYDKRIEMLMPFVAKHPASKLVDEVKKLGDLLGEEKEKVDGGGVKLNGVWISGEERLKQRYNVDAKILFWRMQGFVKSQEEYEALRVFDTLETEYSDSTIFPESVLLARELLPKVEADLNRMILRNPQLIEERMAGLKKLETSEVEYQKTKDAIDAERREFDQATEREKVAKSKWITFYAYDLASLEDALDLVRKESNRLLEFNVAMLRTTANLTSQIRDSLYIKDLGKAEDILKAAGAAGGDKKTLDKWKKEIERMRKEATEGVPKTPPKVTPRDPAVSPPTDPTGDLQKEFETPLQRNTREREEKLKEEREATRKKAEEDAAAAASVRPTVPPTPTPTVTDGGGTVEAPPTPESPDTPGAPVTAEAPVPAPAGGTTAGTGPKTPEGSVKPVSAPVKEKPQPTPAKPAKGGGGLPLWNYILIGVAGVLLVVTVVAKAIQKKKGAGAGGE